MTTSATPSGPDLAAQLQRAIEQIESYRDTLTTTVTSMDALFVDRGQHTASDDATGDGAAAAALGGLTSGTTELQEATQQFVSAVEALNAQVAQALNQLQSDDASWDQGYSALQGGLETLGHASDEAATSSATAMTSVQTTLQTAQQATQEQLDEHSAAAQTLTTDITSNVQPSVTTATQTFQTTISGPQTTQTTDQLSQTYAQVDSSLDGALQAGSDANQSFQNTVADGSQTLASDIASGVADPVAQAAQQLTDDTLSDLSQTVADSVSTVEEGTNVASALSPTLSQTKQLKDNADGIKHAITASATGQLDTES